MQDATHEASVREIMDQFALKTGLSTSAQSPERYLWTAIVTGAGLMT